MNPNFKLEQEFQIFLLIILSLVINSNSVQSTFKKTKEKVMKQNVVNFQISIFP